MSRRCALAVGAVAALIAGASTAGASSRCAGTNVLAAGEKEIAIVDVDQDGIDEDDCVFTATSGVDGAGYTTNNAGYPSGRLCIHSNQPGGPTQLLICQDVQSEGTYDVGMGVANATLSNFYGTGNFAGASSPFDGSPAVAAGKGSAAVNGPVPILYGRVEQALPSFGAMDYGSGFLCNAGGPAISILDVAGVRIVLRFRPVAVDGKNYLCLRMPFQSTYGGFVWREACFPVREDGSSDLASALDPENPTVVFPLDELPACAMTAAPTLGAWSLIVLALGLLGGGTWLLRRRRSFSELLPTP